MNTLQPASRIGLSIHDGGPTPARKAAAFTLLIASALAFVVMILWPVVARFT